MLVAFFAVLLGLIAGAAPAAGATTFAVDKTTDPPGFGGCTALADDCSLRDAVTHANIAGPGNTISLPAGRYVLSLAGSDDGNSFGDLDLAVGTSLVGAGAATTTIDAGGIDRALDIWTPSSATTSLSGLTVTGGAGVADGAGIYMHDGTLNVADCVIAGNHIAAASSGGGGIYAGAGTLNVDRSTFSGNTVHDGEAGAIYTSSAGLNVTNTTFSDNHATGIYEAGAIYNQAAMTIVNSTFTGNSTETEGGAIDVSASSPAKIVNSTLAGNAASAHGGGIAVAFGSSVEIENSIIAGNSSPDGSNCRAFGTGVITSKGHNIDSGAGCGFTAAGDLQNTDPLLAALADNGGPTQTLALKQGSPAIDAADGTASPATDQRGVSRPQFKGYDIGAFEYVDDVAPVISKLRVKRGLKVGYVLSENATVTVRFARLRPGHKHGRRCKAGGGTGKRCTAAKSLRGTLTFNGKAGSNRFKFSGRLKHKKLAPGKYRLLATAKDAWGNTGKTAHADFSIKR